MAYPDNKSRSEMPDVDHFCYGVRGLGSRTLVNLVLGEAPLDAVVRQAELMVVKQLNQEDVRSVLGEVVCALSQGLAQDGYLLAELRTRIRTLKRTGEVAAIAVRAAEAVFCSVVSCSSQFEPREIQVRFLQQFAGDLIEGRALNHVREQLIRDCGRTVGQHFEWTDSVRQGLSARMPRLVETVFSSDRRVRCQFRHLPSTRALLGRRVA